MNAFSDVSFERTIDYLRNFQFDLAAKSCISINDIDLRTLTFELSQCISTQKTPSKSCLKISSNSDPRKDILLKMIKGYSFLNRDHPDALKSYYEFSSAVQLSEQTENHNLTKIAILAILDLIKSEIYIGSQQYKPYLDHFEELSSDKTDEYLATYYASIFKSKANDNLKAQESYDETVDELERIIANFPYDHPFHILMQFEKGIQNKLMDNFSGAERHFLTVDSMTRGNPYWTDLHNTNLWQLSVLKFEQGMIHDAEFYLNESRKVSKTLRDSFYDDRLNAWILHHKRVFDSAYFFLDRSVSNEYKLGSKNNSLETALLSVENQTNKLKLDKTRLQSQKHLSQSLLIFAAAIIILGLIIGVLYRKNTMRKRKISEQNIALGQQRFENLLKKQELATIDAMIEGREKERVRVANELHDELGSLMATIKLHLGQVRAPKSETSLKSAEKLVETAYDKIRTIAHTKNSGVLGDGGLKISVETLVNVINRTNKLQLKVEHFGHSNQLENSLQLTIFRFIQELITNVLKHSKATKASIQISQYEDYINLIVEDNGKGFVSPKETIMNGMGIKNIEKRVEHLGGNFTIDSVEGKGSSIIIDIPL